MYNFIRPPNDSRKILFYLCLFLTIRRFASQHVCSGAPAGPGESISEVGSYRLNTWTYSIHSEISPFRTLTFMRGGGGDKSEISPRFSTEDDASEYQRLETEQRILNLKQNWGSPTTGFCPPIIWYNSSLLSLRRQGYTISPFKNGPEKFAVECRTCHQEVVGSSLSRALRRNNSGQFVFASVTPSSITSYRSKGGCLATGEYRQLWSVCGWCPWYTRAVSDFSLLSCGTVTAY